MALPITPARPGLRVAVAGEVGREGVEARGGERGQDVTPHVGGLGIAVDQQHGRVAGGAGFAMVKVCHGSADARDGPPARLYT